MFWYNSNPHYCEVEHHPPHAMASAAKNSEHLFAPYFFDRPLNHLNYLAVLEHWFIPQLQSLGIESNVWLQQDMAPAYFVTTVREYYNKGSPSC